MELTPLKKRLTLSEQAYEEIRNAILSGKLHPGDVLTEEKLSEELSISRTPIRTALQQLTYQGLVSAGPNKNLIVTQVTKEDIKMINPIRCSLETLAISLIDFDSVPLSSIEHLESLHQQQTLCVSDSTPDYSLYLSLDHEFHMSIVKLAQNPYLNEMSEKTSLLFNRFLLLSGTLEKHSKEALDEHLEILQFIQSKKYDFSVIAMKKHIQNAGDRILQ